MQNKKDTSQYDEEPVLYCEHCLSLKVRDVPNMKDSDYCDDCGATSIALCSIEEWQEKYKARYGHYYLDNF